MLKPGSRHASDNDREQKGTTVEAAWQYRKNAAMYTNYIQVYVVIYVG